MFVVFKFGGVAKQADVDVINHHIAKLGLKNSKASLLGYKQFEINSGLGRETSDKQQFARARSILIEAPGDEFLRLNNEYLRPLTMLHFRWIPKISDSTSLVAYDKALDHAFTDDKVQILVALTLKKEALTYSAEELAFIRSLEAANPGCTSAEGFITHALFQQECAKNTSKTKYLAFFWSPRTDIIRMVVNREGFEFLKQQSRFLESIQDGNLPEDQNPLQ